MGVGVWEREGLEPERFGRSGVLLARCPGSNPAGLANDLERHGFSVVSARSFSAAVSEAAAPAHQHREESEQAPAREHRGGRGRNQRSRNGPSHAPSHAPSHRERPPAPVTRIEEARPRREPKPAPQVSASQIDDGAGSHLPAFLLRPFRAKA